MRHHWLRHSRYMSFVWCYDGPTELANSNESSRQLLSSEESGEVSQDTWDSVAGLSQASRAHRHCDMSRVLFIVFELMLHGYSVAFWGGMTEEIEGHLSVALEWEITLFWHYEQGCDNFSLFRWAWRSWFMTVRAVWGVTHNAEWAAHGTGTTHGAGTTCSAGTTRGAGVTHSAGATQHSAGATHTVTTWCGQQEVWHMMQNGRPAVQAWHDTAQGRPTVWPHGMGDSPCNSAGSRRCDTMWVTGKQ